MSSTTGILIGLALGAILGSVIGWLLGSRRQPAAPAVDTRWEEELRQQVAQRETDLNKSRDEITRLNTARATSDAQRDAAEKNLDDQRRLYERVVTEAKLTQDKALADLREVFKGLSAEALKQTAPEFIRLAEQSYGKFQEAAKGDLAQRQEAIKVLVEPLKQQLETYQKRLQQSEVTQSSTLGEVKKQLDMLSQSNLSLAAETQQFRMVLKSNQARGRWGEETLQRVVEAAGMSAHCDFSKQATSGDSKPDLIVRLPGDRLIIVDAKVPDLDFLNAMDSADVTKRTEALAIHAERLKNTVKDLGARDYPKQFPNALDYVVLFLPAESLFSAALEGDHDLIIWAAKRKIMFATPASLIALLRSVSVSWQQHAQSENAQAIAAAAQELYQRVTTFTTHFEKIRDGLEKANNAYNDAVGSYERSIKPSGERVLKLGGGVAGKDLAEVSPLEASLRLPPAT